MPENMSRIIPKKEIANMKIAGIIAEYNPFHGGHAYQIEQTRKAGASHMVAGRCGTCGQRG